MKPLTILTIIAALALAGCAAAPKAGHTIQVPPDRHAECEAQGGCHLVSMVELLQLAGETYDLGVMHGGQAGYEAGQRACKRAPS